MTEGSGYYTTWRYDVRGRAYQEVKVIASQPFTTTTGYNALNQVVTTTYPDGEVVTTAYNAATQPVSLSGNTTYVTGTVYTALGQISRYTWGTAGMATEYGYDGQTSRLLNIRVGTLLDLRYSFDRAGNVTAVSDTSRSELQRFSYDSLDRLTAATTAPNTDTFADEFSTTSLNGNWQWYSPVSGAGYSLTARSGYLRLSVPAGTSYDHWTSVDRAPQVRTQTALASSVAGDWTVETEVSLTSYTSGSPFHTGIMVYFGQNDVAYWGPYMGTTLRLERSGQAALLSVANSVATVWLRVRKTGTTYVFEYKTSAGGAWIAAGQRVWDEVPTKVGIIAKTWGGGAALTADYASFRLSGPGNATTLSYTYDAIGNLLSKSGVGIYTYTTSGAGSVRPHAVTAAGSGRSFGYDANGNMVTRVLSGTTYTLVYDAENRLAAYKQGSTVLASYTYDADGTLVRKVAGGQTTVYVGATYEKNLTTGVVTKYYYLGGQRVAMRAGSNVTWIHGDHLGSASLTTNTSGAVMGEMRYYPYGQTRWSTGTVPTDRRYTGQREETGLGLYDYGARYYDPALGRFIQADTIVPEPGNPQSLNRYAYVYNSPLGYNDPDGHNPLLIALLALGIAAGAGYFSYNYEGLGYWALAVNSPAIISPRVKMPESGAAMSPWLIDQMKTNAQSDTVSLIRQNWQGGPAEMAGALAGWNALVRTGAIWDFKGDLKEASIKTVTLGGREFNYQAVANIHYGFVGRAAGIGGEILRSGAGVAQLKWLMKDSPGNVGPLAYQTSSGDWAMSYFDQPFDAWCVLFGIYLYELYGTDLDEAAFDAALEQFIQENGEPPEL